VLAPCLENVFDGMDSLRVGRLSLESVMLQLPSVKLPKGMPKKLCQMIQGERLMDIFSCVIDDGGAMSKREFVNVICELACSDVDVETMQMLHLLRHIQARVSQLEPAGAAAPARWQPSASLRASLSQLSVIPPWEVEAPQSCPSCPSTPGRAGTPDSASFSQSQIGEITHPAPERLSVLLP